MTSADAHVSGPDDFGFNLGGGLFGDASREVTIFCRALDSGRDFGTCEPEIVLQILHAVTQQVSRAAYARSMSASKCSLCDTWDRTVPTPKREAHAAALVALADRAACAESFAFQIADPDPDHVTQNALWNAARRMWAGQYKVASPFFSAIPVSMDHGTADCANALAIRERIDAAESVICTEGDGLDLAETRSEREDAYAVVRARASAWLAWRRGDGASVE